MPSTIQRPSLLLPRTSTTAPFSANETDRAHAMALRLGQEMLNLLSITPRTGASAVSLARDLKIERTLCHRTCSALDMKDDWIEMLLRLPGPDSLKTFVTAAGKKTGNPEARQAALAAVEQFQRLIWELGGSQTRFNTRLKALRTQHSAARELDEPEKDEIDDGRMTVFDGARKVMGMSAEATVQLVLIRPKGDGVQFVQDLIVGCRGLRSNNAMYPISPAIRSVSRVRKATAISDIGKDAGEKSPESLGVMTEFSSKPLPKVYGRELNNGNMLIADLGSAPAEGTDLFFRKVLRSLSLDDMPSSMPALVHQVRTPTRHVTLDLFVHRSIPTTGVASVSAVYPWFLSKNDLDTAWQDALPGELRLELLGAGLDGAHCSEWSRQYDLCAQVMSESGHDPSEFIGYRCRTAYPYWGASYVVNLELATVTRTSLQHE